MLALALPINKAISVGWPMGMPISSSSVCETLALLHMLAVPNNAERALNSMHFSVTCLVVLRGLALPPAPLPPVECSRVSSSIEALRTKYPPLFLISYPTPVNPKHKDGNVRLYIDRAVISFCVKCFHSRQLYDDGRVACHAQHSQCQSDCIANGQPLWNGGQTHRNGHHLQKWPSRDMTAIPGLELSASSRTN